MLLKIDIAANAPIEARPGGEPAGNPLLASRDYRENFLYFSRCGMTLSVPSRRILSAS